MDKALDFNLEAFLNTVARLIHLIKIKESVQIGQLLSFRVNFTYFLIHDFLKTFCSTSGDSSRSNLFEDATSALGKCLHSKLLYKREEVSFL